MQLAGHPLRWQLLRELGRSDRMVHELTRLVGQSQNLVSYHLGKLREARLVSARRSSADRRDTYYSVDLVRFGDLLSVTGAAVHPGLRLTAAAATPAASGARPVLFLCTGNSARSQMAQALVRVRSEGRIQAWSAGSHPKEVHQDAVRVMKDEYGINLAGQQSKHFSVFAQRRFDRVISLCDRVRNVCPDFPGHPEAVHWSIPDPSAEEAGYAAFQQTARNLDTRITFLIAEIVDAAKPPQHQNRRTRDAAK